jgi:hypothetical protein
MIKTKINSNKNYSLFVFSLIIGGLFFTNINNNILGIEQHHTDRELTDENKEGAMNFLISYASVHPNQEDTLRNHLYTLCHHEDWRVKNNILKNKNDKIVTFPLLMKTTSGSLLPKKFLAIILDYKSINNKKNSYPEGSDIVLSQLNNNGKNFYFGVHTIVNEISNKAKIKELLQEKINIDNYCISLKKVVKNKKWKTQILCDPKNYVIKGKKIIDIKDNDELMKQELEQIWNTSTYIYSSSYPFLNPYNVKEAPFTIVLAAKIDSNGLENSVLRKLLKKEIKKEEWLTSADSGREWITHSKNSVDFIDKNLDRRCLALIKMLLFPTKLQDNGYSYIICDPNNIKAQETIIFQYIDHIHLHIYDFYYLIMHLDYDASQEIEKHLNHLNPKVRNKSKEEIIKFQITKTILAKIREQILTVAGDKLEGKQIYLIQQLQEGELKTYLDLRNNLTSLAKIAITPQSLKLILKLARLKVFNIYEKWGIEQKIQEKKTELQRLEAEKLTKEKELLLFP